jgi:hypothetical protein
MKTYSYYHYNQPISKNTFLDAVPYHWESDTVNGEYSYGYYRASEIIKG